MFISRFLPSRLAKAYGSDNSGMAAVEFALIAPVALVMMLGAIEYSRAVVMARRFNLVTATVSDLIARDDFEDAGTMTGIEHAVETIWSPYDRTSLKLNVIAVRQAAATAVKVAPFSNYVDWGMVLPDMTAVTRCSGYAGLPAGLLSPGSSTIVVNATYTYHTLFNVKVPGMATSSQNWTSSSSHAPRNLCVGWGAANCTPACE